MEKKRIEIEYDILTNSELTDKEKELIGFAIKATESSYAPYSLFNVGAAVRLSDGTIVKGSNQENGAYPSGLCAERTAVFSAQANFPNQSIREIAIIAKTKGEIVSSFITPCGACLQVIAEAEMRAKNPIMFYLCSSDKVMRVKGVKSLMPFAFSLDECK